MRATRMLLLGLPATLGLILGGSLALSQQPRPQRHQIRLTAAERAQCNARHGRIAIAGLSGDEMCALPFRDAGRRCTNGSQCAGDCMYDGPPPRPGQRLVGQCEAYAYGFGCRTTLENGRVTAMCVD